MDNMGNIWKYTINIAYHAHICCSMDPINILQSCLHIYTIQPYMDPMGMNQ